MSQENVAIVRRFYETLSRTGEFDVAAVDRDWEFVSSPEIPEAGTYRGEEALRFIQSFMESFEEFAVDTEDFVEVGDKVVVTRYSAWPREGRHR